MRRDMRFVGFLTGIVAVGCFCPAQAASGDLDPTFGTLGKVTTAIGPADDWGCAVALQADGKIVVGGMRHNSGKWDFALARYEGFTPKP
jgi:hypothetical protein